MTRTRTVLSTILAISLATACQSRGETSTPNASSEDGPDSLFYEPKGEFDDPGSLRIGNRGPGPGGGFSVSVGEDFGKPEAAEVYRRLVALDSSGEFKQFSCGDEVPHFGFDLTIQRESEVQERIVTLGHTPRLAPWGAQQCISRGFSYIVARTFAQVDSGPSVDYGYKNPSTGKRYPPKDPGERHSRWWPTCHCEMSRDNQDWVTNGPEETSLGANAH